MASSCKRCHQEEAVTELYLRDPTVTYCPQCYLEVESEGDGATSSSSPPGDAPQQNAPQQNATQQHETQKQAMWNAMNAMRTEPEHEAKNDTSRSFLLVLDLDGTLVCDDSPLVVWRPGVERFCRSLTEAGITMAVWSAAGKERVEEAARHLRETCQVELLFVWHAAQCTFRRRPREGCGGGFYEHHDAQLRPVKSLSKVWRKGKIRKLGFTKANTLILDNTASTGVDNYGNLLRIKTWRADDEDAAQDEELTKIATELLRYRDLNDAREIARLSNLERERTK